MTTKLVSFIRPNVASYVVKMANQPRERESKKQWRWYQHRIPGSADNISAKIRPIGDDFFNGLPQVLDKRCKLRFWGGKMA